jgi:solute carrier family 25 (mitochondrial carnitine/acylcarnitine transporter), member 20/29
MTTAGTKEEPSNNAMAQKEEKTMTGNRLQGAMSGSGTALQEAAMGLLGGMLFGMVSPVVGHPMDTVKTRMQAEAAYHDTGVFQTVRQIYAANGVRGFYRGFIPPLVGSMGFRGILFSVYGGAYSTCEKVPILREEIPFTGGLRSSVFIAAVAAAFSRAVIESPLDFMKVRAMIGKAAMQDSSGRQVPVAEVTTISWMRTFASSPIANIRHLYSGFVPTLFRTIGLVGSFFVLVDYSVRYIPDVINAPLIGPFFKGGVCATAAWTFAFPFESAKSVIQADTTGKYKNMSLATFKVMKQLYEERGIARGLYRGFGPGASRSFFANGASMIVYSWFQEHVRS